MHSSLKSVCHGTELQRPAFSDNIEGPAGVRRALSYEPQRVTALALEQEHVLATVIGQLNNGERRARRHHLTDCRERGMRASIQCGGIANTVQT